MARWNGNTRRKMPSGSPGRRPASLRSSITLPSSSEAERPPCRLPVQTAAQGGALLASAACEAHCAWPRAPGHPTRVTTAWQQSAVYERIRFMGRSASDHGADYKTTNAEESRHALEPGTSAPNFTLHTTPDQAVSLTSFRGQPVILAFYPADWSPVCGDEVTLLNEVLPE